MIIAITGTPGTGKSELGKELARRNLNVIFLTDFIRENGLLGEYDGEMGSYNVETEELDEALAEYGGSSETYYAEGHLSHFLTCSAIIVIRCSPEVLAGRLEARGYSQEKVKENVQAEVLDVILCEADSADIPVYELDSTSHTVGELSDSVLEIADGKVEKYLPGNTDWTGDIDRWF
ncbi:MAG: adenylate kinase family protein [Methanomassiliicoccaceae archaeon]|nr:adenylate kinase family protein [Methanomassiliicoccaceae archaeon]